MRPDATKHNPNPDYLRSLIEAAGLSQRAAAARIGISDRALRYYLEDRRSDGTDRVCPYAVQYALEALSK